MDITSVKKEASPVEQMIVIKCRRPTFKCCFYLFFILLLVIAFRMNSFITKHGIIQTKTQLKIIPSTNDWQEYYKCLSDIQCDSCSAPIVSFVTPSTKITALLSMYGTGGSYLRETSTNLLRVHTGMHDNCYFNLPNDCSNTYHYSHFLYTRFISVSSLVTLIDVYKPSQIVYLTRNPFHSIVAAYHYYTQCINGDLRTKLFCLKKKAVINKKDVAFERFAEAYAQEYELQQKYINTWSNSSIIIYYEDLMSINNKQSLNVLFNYINNGQLSFNTDRVLQCSGINPLPYETNDIDKDIFSPELIKKVCKYIGKYWNENKFGKTYCYI
jgi:hypothetical protein